MNRTEYIKQQAKCELARREFFYYCNLKAPDFYKVNRTYLLDKCNKMQDFLTNDEEVLIINEPPRHGKSRSASCFTEWVFGIDPKLKVMTGSYNETLSTTFSKGVRDTIKEVKVDENRVVYSDVFPNTKIKYGDSAMNLWSLEGGHNNYLATSPGGTATGFGADIMIIDDVIKNAKEAYNDRILEGHWKWFTETMYSRLEGKRKLIIIMTRWHSKDLCGRILEWCEKNNKKYQHINYQAQKEDGTMLCEGVLSAKEFEDIKSINSPEIVSANYQQEPIDIKGGLYKSFRTYDKLPVDHNGNSLLEAVLSYTDTADEGDDYLCSITFGVYQHLAYVLDVIFTKDGMEITEPLVAEAINTFKVAYARIESNNGGRGFARAVIRISRDELDNHFSEIKWFHQSGNKKARILSNATYVQNNIVFPTDWHIRWPEFYNCVVHYQKEGKNAHDDAEDTLTGVAETMILGGY